MEPATQLDPVAEAALRSLRDIALPQPVSWMPQTWGWALLAGLLVVAILVALFAWIRRYRRNAYRREALRLLDDIVVDIRNPSRRERGIHALTELLKRTALAAWPRSDVAALSGAAWARFLDERDHSRAATALARLLDDFEYHDRSVVAGLPSNVADDLVLRSRRWIARHHVSA